MKSTTNRPASRAGNRAVAGKRANSTSIAAVEEPLSRLIGEKGTDQDSTCCHPNVTKHWKRKVQSLWPPTAKTFVLHYAATL